MSRRPARWLALVLAVVAVFLLGCTEVERARAKERADRFKRLTAEKMLQERVDEYWDFARWYTWSETARFLERDEDQRVHLEQGTDGDPTLLPKMDAVEVQFIFVDADTLKTGSVKVRWKEIANRTTEVVEKTTTQRWYKRGGQWWLAPEDGIPPDPHDELGGKVPDTESVPDLETVEAVGSTPR